MGRKAKDITGQRFGRLVAIEPTDERRHNNVVWKCKCDCENMVLVSGEKLIRGNTQSCGCLKRERTTEENSIKSAIKSNRTWRTNTSGYTGVSWCAKGQKWRAYISLKNHGNAYLGRYEDINDAIRIRKLAEEAVMEDRFEEFYKELKSV